MKMWLQKAGVLLLVLSLGAIPLVTFGHATPIVYTPATGATERTVPHEISIRFTERIETGASSLTVFGPNGEEVNEGKGTLSDAEGRTLVVPIRDIGEGVYTVSWQVVSVDDGHFTKGANSFLVDATGKKFEGNAGGTEILYVTRLPEAIYSFFGLLGESILLAAIIFLMCILRLVYPKRNEEDRDVWARLKGLYTHLIAFGFLFILFGGLITIFKKTSELAALQSTTFFETVWLYSQTSVGIHSWAKILAAGLFAALFLSFRKKLFNSEKVTFLEWVLLILVVVIVYLQSNLSHAAASLFHPLLSIWITVFHLFAKELVIGGAILIACLLFDERLKIKTDALRKILPRYDALAALAILIAGSTGVYVTWLHLKRFDNLFSTEWGNRFVILLILTAALGFMRLFHQFIIHPLIPRVGVSKVYRSTLLTEVIIGLSVLFFSGYISITTPPFTVEEYHYAVESRTESGSILLETHPYENRSFRILFKDEKGAITPPSVVTVTATNREKGIGPNVLVTEKRFPGAYVFPRADLSPSGTWEVEVIAARDGAYDLRGAFKIIYPDDVTLTRYTDEVRAYNEFAQVLIILGVFIGIFSLFLFLHAWIRVRATKEESLNTAALVNTQSVVVPFSTALIISLIMLGVSWLLYLGIVGSSFKQSCLQDGHEWRQSFPTRNFETAAPNAVNGCFVHDGHYHFIDEREYNAFIEGEV